MHEFDDGGTPAWRARHRVIDVSPPLGLWGRWKALPIGSQAILVLAFAALAYVIPAVVLVVGAAGMAIGLWRYGRLTKP